MLGVGDTGPHESGAMEDHAREGMVSAEAPVDPGLSADSGGAAGAENGYREGPLEDMMDVQMDEATVRPDREPYEVPPEWARVLRAWNDPAIGAGLPDSAVSTGEFEHELRGDDDGGAAAAGDLEQQAASSSTERSRLSRSTDASEGWPKQTDLKSWLK